MTIFSEMMRPTKKQRPASEEMPADGTGVVYPHGDLGTSRVMTYPIVHRSISKATNRSLNDERVLASAASTSYSLASNAHQELNRVVGEAQMLEYVAYALLGVATIGCLLYVTMSPEAEETPKPPDFKQ